ncbi:hypothetical protein QTG54_005685 [Skeletonema marinoi]|uniref:Uncharacterized protein n=1 Tax=Skeletonema marinoi TaxID=267567 RepID=A0AAD9DFW5_9STRA|nr:hypothetical protein QTG54_005685 [Skeletonema marinoi]
MTIWSPLSIESTVLEISLSSVGIITTKLITNGETIVQATKSAHITPSSSVGELLSVPCSSSLAFLSSLTSKREYSIVIPSVYWPITSMQLQTPSTSTIDRDERQARYLVWSTRERRMRFGVVWMEAKYGVPVKHVWEWDDEEEDGAKDDDEAAEDLDGEGEEDEVKGEEL